MTQNQHGTQHMSERGFDDNLEAARPLLAAHFIASLGLNLREVAKCLREVLATQPLSPLQLGIQYQSSAHSLSFKVISMENSLTAGYTSTCIHTCTGAHIVTKDRYPQTWLLKHPHPMPSWGVGGLRLVYARGLYKQAFNWDTGTYD